MNTPFYTGALFGYALVLTPWKLIGLTGALMFASRWFVQAYYSRKAGKPVVPRVFWVMSVVGSLSTLAYFTFAKTDMVGVIQNLFPSLICSYNLYLDLTHEKRMAARAFAVRAEKTRPAGAVISEPAAANE